MAFPTGKALDRGQRAFYEESGGKYFILCRSCDLCSSSSTLLVQRESNPTCEQMRVAVFQQNVHASNKTQIWILYYFHVSRNIFLFFKLFKTVKMVASPSGTVGQIWLWLSHTRIGGSCEHQYTCWRRKTTNKGITERQKPNYNKRAHTNRRKDKPRVSRQGDQRPHHWTSRIPTIVHPTKTDSKVKHQEVQKQKKRVT